MRQRRLETDDRFYYDSTPCTDNNTRLAGDKEQREMERLVEFLREGGLEYLPEKKKDGWVRIMFENWNSLGVFTQSWKIERLNNLTQQLQIDIVMGCEAQCDWTFTEHGKHFLDLLCPELAKKGIAHVVSRYYEGHTVWEQQSQFWQAKGEFCDPVDIHITNLVSFMHQCRSAGEEVVLAMDVNQDVYTGKLAKALAKLPLNITCLFEPVLGDKVPNSHFCGSEKISTIFGTPRLLQGHGICYPHWYGIGDHRVFVIEILADSLFGGELPAIATPKAR
jgi:hypothetical protein